MEVMEIDTPNTKRPAPTSPGPAQKPNGIFVKNQWMCNCMPSRLPATIQKVRKMGRNEGRQFWTCSKSSGQQRLGCGFFLWIEEARQRELKALSNSGQMPTKTATPSRPLRQIKISESFQKSSVAASNRAKGKGKVASVRFQEENVKPKTSPPGDVVDLASDSALEEQEDVEGVSLIPEHEEICSLLNHDADIEYPELPDEEELFNPMNEGPRKIPRTRKNSSPSKQLAPEQPAMASTSRTSFNSTASTVVDEMTPSKLISDLNIKTPSANARQERQNIYNSVTPVSFPNLKKPGDNRKTASFPPVSTKSKGPDDKNPFKPSPQISPAQTFHTPSTGIKSASFNGRPSGATSFQTPGSGMTETPSSEKFKPSNEAEGVQRRAFEILNKHQIKLPQVVLDELRMAFEADVKRQKGYIQSRNAVRTQLRNAQNALQEANSTIQEKTAELDYAKQQYNHSQIHVKSIQSVSLKQDEDIKKLQKEKQDLQTQLYALEDKEDAADELKKENSSLRARITALENLQAENDALKADYRNVQAEVSSIYDRYSGSTTRV